MNIRTKTVLKNNKTTKSLKITIGDSHYSIIMNKKIKKPIGTSNCEFSFSCRKFYTNRFFLYPDWEKTSPIEVPRDLVHDMISFIQNNDESFSENSLHKFDSTGKYDTKQYEVSAHAVRLCTKSNFLYIGRGGTYSDSSFSINLFTNTVYAMNDTYVNVLDDTIVPYFEHFDRNLNAEELERIEVQNFEYSLLPNYAIYVELREFIEKIKNDISQTYEWPFTTFLPYGDIL